ncbi:glycoside hydrolase family 31 protein [Vibrio fluvialis]|uniref:glycoside hydrolase family 31 protein n=1 Tax=Vibrio fluvialis TaxID=676 RepID=UPI000C223659|nr:glycoside hydrolase family 31 protein [Vibrio fluvialis]MBY7823529.1 glycoside hydrolase family 31 protein [Vibrio fluvialis]MBY7883115.1 glycoside hydrolase family 31 protein [Vibrio fluvialis]MBY7925791.1 glycoside hydrolase family 31 protein [Vibrio fluvialis]MBY8007837.1 glycoside hydrolase family 31 protein [Vibrio fluvialis]MBY8251654.1 glycoside hydrolase family 31 protein [Vibrio fluvialis]
MKTLKHWEWDSAQDNEVILRCDSKHTLHIFILEKDIFRVLVKKNQQLRLDRTWTVSPSADDIAWNGRERTSTQGYSLPDYQLTRSDDEIEIATDRLKLTITQPLQLHWSHFSEGDWQPLAHDRKTGAIQLATGSQGVAHFMHRGDDEYYFGLGEKTGNLNREGRRFEMRNLDAMGYNASSTDPLYKHIPFYITRTPQNVSYGLFYDNLASCWFDLGNELDNYHIKYRSYRAEDGDLDFYFILGPSVLDVTRAFTKLTGGTLFGPKWSLGYSGSTMRYTDEPNSQELLESFVDQCQEHQIPCDSFQLSSGYTSIGDKRYVFNWNSDKVPNPQGMSAHFHQHGLKLAANIKPCLLHDHPMYQDVKQQGLFIQDSESDTPEISVFWDADGSHLDFTNPKTVDWWKHNVTTQLLEKGIDATWNDNNEYEIWDQDARCFGFGNPIPVGLIRPLQPLLMMKASYHAQREFAPHLRPYLISRSGCPGMNRYVQTWSGDNRTNWTSLKYNIKMGLGMSLSGLYNLGHDVGGFSGDKPDPELFVRWVQNGVMHPRFTIHSWNDDGTVNEPWMYPEVTPIIRKSMALRYQLMPYLYDALWQAHRHHQPMLRPTFLDHEHDANTWSENDDFMLGQSLLVASVVEPGQREREVYLPDNTAGWYDFYTHQWFSAGQTITLPAELETLPLLVKAGCALPLNRDVGVQNTQDDHQRTILLFPAQGAHSFTQTIFDDDGESYAYQDGQYLELALSVTSDAKNIHVSLTRGGDFKPDYSNIEIRLPQTETRQLVINGELAGHSYRFSI